MDKIHVFITDCLDVGVDVTMPDGVVHSTDLLLDDAKDLLLKLHMVVTQLQDIDAQCEAANAAMEQDNG